MVVLSPREGCKADVDRFRRRSPNRSLRMPINYVSRSAIARSVSSSADRRAADRLSASTGGIEPAMRVNSLTARAMQTSPAS